MKFVVNMENNDDWLPSNKTWKKWTRICHKPPRYVPYKYTYVPYDGTFGASDQGQMLDV